MKYLLALLLPLALLAEPTQVFRAQKFSSLKTHGFVRLIECEVTGLTEIDGTLETNDCTLNHVIVQGPTYLRGTDVKGRGEFHGELSARTSNFLMPIMIESNTAQIASCKTRNITMQTKELGPIYLHLTGTLVIGNIVFTKGRGHVTLDRGSSIRGTITGGKQTNHGSSHYN